MQYELFYNKAVTNSPVLSALLQVKTDCPEDDAPLEIRAFGLQLIVDVSNSMKGSRLTEVQHWIRTTIDSLPRLGIASDVYLTIIIGNKSARTLVPWTKVHSGTMDAEEAEKIEQACMEARKKVDGMNAESSTWIDRWLAQAEKSFEEFQRVHPGSLFHSLCLSDGGHNGDEEALDDIIETLANKGFTCNALGFGDEYNEKLLLTIATPLRGSCFEAIGTHASRVLADIIEDMLGKRYAIQLVVKTHGASQLASLEEICPNALSRRFSTTTSTLTHGAQVNTFRASLGAFAPVEKKEFLLTFNLNGLQWENAEMVNYGAVWLGLETDREPGLSEFTQVSAVVTNDPHDLARGSSILLASSLQDSNASSIIRQAAEQLNDGNSDEAAELLAGLGPEYYEALQKVFAGSYNPHTSSFSNVTRSESRSSVIRSTIGLRKPES